MKVQVRLNLPEIKYKLIMKYNTFEKVSFDKYLIASLIYSSTSQNSAYQFIDQLSGDGSLNEHFKKLYLEINEMSKDEIYSILQNSQYPVLKISEEWFRYYPLLNISKYHNHIYCDNLANDKSFPLQLIEQGGTYVSHNYEQGQPESNVDRYDVILEPNKIQLKVVNDFYPISELDFQRIVVKDSIDLSAFRGDILKALTGNDWIQMSQSNYRNIMDAKDYYYENGNHFGIYNDYVKESSIAFAWGLYWLKERTYYYRDPSSKEQCTKVANVLLETGMINEFKTKSLVEILKNISRDLQQTIVNYILQRKDSKDLINVGYILMDKGYEKGWFESSLLAFYKYRTSTEQLIKVYSHFDSDIYTISDLLEIEKYDKSVLRHNHSIQLEVYHSDRNKIINTITSRVGVVTSSSVRDNIGRLRQDEETKRLKKLMNKYIGHMQKDINTQSLEQLKKIENDVEEMYLLHLRVKQELERLLQ
ncbi:MAG: hypothetical protein AB7U79_02435 [Candidatus Izemoplasmatales bacterium]